MGKITKDEKICYSDWCLLHSTTKQAVGLEFGFKKSHVTFMGSKKMFTLNFLISFIKKYGAKEALRNRDFEESIERHNKALTEEGVI